MYVARTVFAFVILYELGRMFRQENVARSARTVVAAEEQIKAADESHTDTLHGSDAMDANIRSGFLRLNLRR